ncbi:MAG: sulfatase-like hydrolase/transferase [Opitutaceae bacterium]|nr:sulfatase-like hydrolase/transferase [Opitutaceae bacterium]
MKSIASTLVALWCLMPVSIAPLRAADRPNILWITNEDMSPNLGCYGDRTAHSPNIDAFAKTAVRYTRAFSAAPVCSPSRATLITGVCANSLGNPHLRCEFSLPEGFEGYAAYLRKAGYYTTNNVKTDYNLRDEARYVREWWNESSDKAHWRNRTPGQPFMAVFNIMDTHQSRSSAWPEEQFEREIASQLSPGERTDPAKVTVPPFYPDTPASRKAMARYYDCIAVMDHKVGAILRELEADGLADDTIVFYYSDHGMGMPRGKRLLHDSGMHVPLLIHFPKKWARYAPGAPGSTVDRLVSFVDFAPTLLSLAGVPIPKHFQGSAFLGDAAKPARRYVFGARDRVDEAFDTARSVRDARWLYIRNFRPHLSWGPPESYSDTSPFRVELLAEAAAGRLGKGPTAWLAPTRPLEELYDTQADPFQIRNLAADPARHAELKRLRAALHDWLIEIRDATFVTEEEVMQHTGGGSPYSWVRSGDDYPLERILKVAGMVGNPAAAADQRASLKDDNSIIRYWAAVGFSANRKAARASRAELLPLLKDPSAAVRIEAAGALLATDDVKTAAQVLLRETLGKDLNAALHAARTLELAGEPARPFLPELRVRWTTAKSRWQKSYLEYYISMALGALIYHFDPTFSQY